MINKDPDHVKEPGKPGNDENDVKCFYVEIGHSVSVVWCCLGLDSRANISQFLYPITSIPLINHRVEFVD